MTFFSIIIPTYNRKDFIVEAIQTVLQQTYPHFEVIVIDDGSTDNTKEGIETRFGMHSQVRYYYRENQERGAARNFGMREAKGNYAVFFDSDDWMKPHYLETLNKVIEENPGIFMLAAKYNFNTGEKKDLPSTLHHIPEGWYDRFFFLKGNKLAINYCIRIDTRSFHEFPEERDLVPMEDWLFLLMNLEKEKIFIRDKICLTMREHAERSMSDNQKVINARIKATAWLLDRLTLNKEEKKTLLAWSYYFCGIHHYLDHNRNASVRETLKAIKLDGPNIKFLMLLTKSILGRRFIKMIK